MKNIFFTVACIVVSVFAFSLASLAAQEDSGRDGSVEWRRLGNLPLKGIPVDMVPSQDGRHFYILTKDGSIAVYSSRGQLRGQIPVNEGVASIDLSPNGEFLFLMDAEQSFISILSVGFIVDIDTAGSPAKGEANAPVTIAVYADFE